MLGADELLEIMLALDVAALSQAYQVCCRWRQAASEPMLWRALETLLLPFGRALACTDEVRQRQVLQSVGRRSTMLLAFEQDGRMHVPCAANDDRIRLRPAPFRLCFWFAEGALPNTAISASTVNSTWRQARENCPLSKLEALQFLQCVDPESAEDMSDLMLSHDEDGSYQQPTAGSTVAPLDADGAQLLLHRAVHQCWSPKERLEHEGAAAVAGGKAAGRGLVCEREVKYLNRGGVWLPIDEWVQLLLAWFT